MADFLVLFENMAGGNNELRERITKLEALIGNVPEGGEIQTLMTRLAYLEAELARLSQENANLKNERVYFHAIHVQDEKEKVILTSMHLSEDAKLWWCTRVTEDESMGIPKIKSWERLKKELKDQFLLINSSWIVRDKLKRLRQTGSVRAYVKEFTSLILSISNMSEEEKLQNFMSELQ
ncbi:uncharacterized protein LOC142163988 [Nicotiana tabacum]|uniref:Uncharacterized protein LOC142163988 n=1 Tax=Nicotiana tabacum TaxID=4097 RepID=A0AC58RWY6_TOBAC